MFVFFVFLFNFKIIFCCPPGLPDQTPIINPDAMLALKVAFNSDFNDRATRAYKDLEARITQAMTTEVKQRNFTSCFDSIDIVGVTPYTYIQDPMHLKTIDDVCKDDTYGADRPPKTLLSVHVKGTGELGQWRSFMNDTIQKRDDVAAGCMGLACAQTVLCTRATTLSTQQVQSSGTVVASSMDAQPTTTRITAQSLSATTGLTNGPVVPMIVNQATSSSSSSTTSITTPPLSGTSIQFMPQIVPVNGNTTTTAWWLSTSIGQSPSTSITPVDQPKMSTTPSLPTAATGTQFNITQSIQNLFTTLNANLTTLETQKAPTSTRAIADSNPNEVTNNGTTLTISSSAITTASQAQTKMSSTTLLIVSTTSTAVSTSPLSSQPVRINDTSTLATTLQTSASTTTRATMSSIVPSSPLSSTTFTSQLFTTTSSTFYDTSASSASQTLPVASLQLSTTTTSNNLPSTSASTATSMQILSPTSATNSLKTTILTPTFTPSSTETPTSGLPAPNLPPTTSSSSLVQFSTLTNLIDTFYNFYNDVHDTSSIPTLSTPEPTMSTSTANVRPLSNEDFYDFYQDYGDKTTASPPPTNDGVQSSVSQTITTDVDVLPKQTATTTTAKSSSISSTVVQSIALTIPATTQSTTVTSTVQPRENTTSTRLLIDGNDRFRILIINNNNN